MTEVQSVAELVTKLNKLAGDAEASDADLVAAFRHDVPRVLDFVKKSASVAERARELLENAYSTQDAEGIRINSEDAVRLQWALREVGVGDDSGDPRFTV